MIGQFLVPPFLQLDLRACPRLDALHMHWERHNCVKVFGLVAGVPILVIAIRWILLNRRWDSPKAIWEPWRWDVLRNISPTRNRGSDQGGLV
jgi:hypothetical protein